MPRFTRTQLAPLGGERVSGAAFRSGILITWGDRLLGWHAPYARPQVLARGTAAFGEGGCLMDVDGKGRLDLVVTERLPGPALVWYRSPDWTRHLIESGVNAADLLPVSLHGRRGVLAVHRGAQLRFYEIPRDPARPWPSQDVYSFYTASNQGGLLMTDVDADGRADLICGNYWIRCPERFELPWRLFAIDTWNEQLPSAMSRLALLDGDLIVCQREMSPARVALFEKPKDPHQLWIPHRLEGALAIDCPQTLVVADFHGANRNDILIGESAGEGRLILFRNRGGKTFEPEVVDRGAPLILACRLGNHALLGVGPSALYSWRLGPE